MRRTLLLLLPLLLLAPGCSTAEGQQAQELLAQADAAQARLASATFEGGVSFTFEGRSAAVRFAGGYSGRDGYVQVRSTLAAANLTVVARGGELWLETAGRWC